MLIFKLCCLRDDNMWVWINVALSWCDALISWGNRCWFKVFRTVFVLTMILYLAAYNPEEGLKKHSIIELISLLFLIFSSSSLSKAFVFPLYQKQLEYLAASFFRWILPNSLWHSSEQIHFVSIDLLPINVITHEKNVLIGWWNADSFQTQKRGRMNY